MYFPIIDVLKENFIAKIPSIVTQWLTDNVNPVGSAVVVDESLSISGAAADAKKTGDELSDLKSDLHGYYLDTGFEKKSNLKWTQGGINSSGTIVENPSAIYTNRISVDGLSSVLLYNGDGEKDGARIYAMVVQYDEAGTFIERAYVRINGVDNRPIKLNESCAAVRFVVGTNLSTGVLVDPSFGDDVSFILYRNIWDIIAIPLARIITENQSIAFANGSEITSSFFNRTSYINIAGLKKIAYLQPVIAESSTSAGMAFYDSERNYISGISNGVNYSKRGVRVNVIDVPEDAAYAKFSYWNRDYIASVDQLDEIPEDFNCYDYSEYIATLSTERLFEAERQNESNIYTETNPLGLHTIPDNIGQLNVVKRCRQMTDIRWTPAVDLPRLNKVGFSNPDGGPSYSYEGVFKQGVEYTGIPYGRCVDYKSQYGKDTTYVGLEIDFDTFITSVGNPDSMICKESVFNLSDRRSIPYAAVCSALTCYALNVPYYPTEYIPTIPNLNKVADLISGGTRIDLSLLKLGDVLNKQAAHTAIITDIVKDSNGDVTYIEICEATVFGNGNQDIEGGQYGGLCRRIGFDVEDFFWRYGAYELLRYANIASVPYTPSKYVNVGDELRMNPYIDLPCMPYEGENFVYESGHIPSSRVRIIISCNDYSYLRVFKGNTEITGSPFSITPSTEYIDITVLDTGNYSAYLCDMSGGSNIDITARCHWSIAS